MPPTLLQAAPSAPTPGAQLLQPATQSASTKSTPWNPIKKTEGMIARVWKKTEEDHDKRRVRNAEIRARRQAGQSLFSTEFQQVGKEAQYAANTIGTAVNEGAHGVYNLETGIRSLVGKDRDLTRDEIKAKDKQNLDMISGAFLKSKAGQDIVSALGQGMEGWQQYKTQHPESAANIESVMSITDLLSNFVGGGAAKKSVVEVGKVGENALETGVKVAAPFVEPLVEGASKVTGAVGDAYKALPSTSDVVAAGKTALSTGKEATSTVGGSLKRGFNVGKEKAAELAARANLPQAEKEAMRVGTGALVEQAKVAKNETKPFMQRMVDTAIRNIGKTKSNAVRPVEVAGEKLVDAAAHVSGVMKAVGKRLGEAKKALRGKVIDLQPVQDSLLADLDELRLAVKNGKIVAQKGVPSDPDVLDVLNDIYKYSNSANDAEVVDLLRSTLSKAFGKTGTPLPPNAQRLATKYREMLLEQIDTVDSNFGALSRQYAEQHKALEVFTKLLGYKGSMEGITKKSLKAGQVAFRSLGNAPADVRAAMDGLISAAKDAGYSNADDLYSLLDFADELENITGAATRSLPGQVERATGSVLEKVPVVGSLLKAGQEAGAPQAAEKLKALKKFFEEHLGPKAPAP